MQNFPGLWNVVTTVGQLFEILQPRVLCVAAVGGGSTWLSFLPNFPMIALWIEILPGELKLIAEMKGS